MAVLRLIPQGPRKFDLAEWRGPGSPSSIPPPRCSRIFHDKTAGTVPVCHRHCHCGTPRGGGGAGGWHKASVSDCLAAPIGLSPLLIRTLCGPERVLVVSPEPPDDLSCLTTPGVGRPGDGAVARCRGGSSSRCRPFYYSPPPHSQVGAKIFRHLYRGNLRVALGAPFRHPPPTSEFGGGGGPRAPPVPKVKSSPAQPQCLKQKTEHHV